MKSNRTNRAIDALIFLMAGTLYVWGITVAVGSTIFAVSLVWMFMISFLSIFIFQVVFYNKYVALVLAILVLLSCTMIYISERNTPAFLSLTNEALTHAKGLIRFITGYENVRPIYKNVICILITITLSIAAGICYRSRLGFYVLLALTLSVLTICFYSRISWTPLPFSACAAGLFIIYLRRFNGNSNITLVLFGTPVIVICLMAAVVISGYSDKNTFALRSVLIKPFNPISDILYPTFAKKYFSFRNTGYVDKNDRMGGNTEIDDRLIMEVEADEQIYLAGAYKDTYTGYSWVNSKDSIESNTYNNIIDFNGDFLINNEFFLNNETPVELLEMAFSNLVVSLTNGEFDFFSSVFENSELIASSVYSSRCEYIPGGVFTIEMQLSAYPQRKITIYNRAAQTFTLFTPQLKHAALITKSENTVWEHDGLLTASELIEINEPYTILYRNTPTISYWSSLKSASSRGVYQRIKKTIEELHEKYRFDDRQLSANLDQSLDTDSGNLHMLKMYPPGSPYFDPTRSISYMDFLENVLIPRAEEIYRRYTVLPDHLPERIKTLTENITSSGTTDYLRALYIRTFLREFPYTLLPGDVPENRDFVDYFLFDGQKGYCTYFASAFVVMCRSIGIPARYVEGFITQGEKNSAGLYEVTNKQAHAWAEVYLEGYGWERFDPTPSSSNEPNEPIPALTALKTTYHAEPDDIKTDFGDITLHEDNANPIPAPGGETDLNFVQDGDSLTSSTKKEALTNVSNADILLKNIWLSTLILILAAILYVILRVMYCEMKEKKLQKNKANTIAMIYYSRFVNWLALFGINVFENESYSAIFRRLGDVISEDGLPVGASKLSELFSQISYSGNEISEKDLAAIKSVIILVEAAFREKEGAIRFFYLKYIKS